MTDPTLDLSDPDAPVVRLVPYRETWPDDDPDANFRAEVATYSRADGLPTIRRLGANLGIPVGAVVRFVLARWASGGSEALMELGPSTVDRMRAVVDQAERTGTDEARLDAYAQIAAMVGWMAHGLDDPAGTYPGGGAAD